MVVSRWPRPAPARACGYAGGLRPLGPLPATMLSLDLGLLTPRGADVTFAPPPRRGTGRSSIRCVWSGERCGQEDAEKARHHTRAHRSAGCPHRCLPATACPAGIVYVQNAHQRARPLPGSDPRSGRLRTGKHAPLCRPGGCLSSRHVGVRRRVGGRSATAGRRCISPTGETDGNRE